jgi:DNA-binding transcriptional MocR family regulator
MSELTQLKEAYQTYLKANLNLDMTRGKPSSEQLDLSMALLNDVSAKDFGKGAKDYRNYSVPGLLTGLPEMKRLFADVLDVDADQIVVGGNSSLNLMYDTLVRALLHSLPGDVLPWGKSHKIKFLCPVPGYDRHFNICQSLDIEMINVPMIGSGPDMDMVEELVANDPLIKGMWCVPKYSNPTGETYSDETVTRLARMRTAAPDFRVFWDNAYAVHHLTSEHDKLANIFTACKKYGTTDRVFMFASTSKITFAGGGVSVFVSSCKNVTWFTKQMANQTIGYDKINQLRHLNFFENAKGLHQLMDKHAAILSPKFNEVDKVLTHELGKNSQYATWNKPNGGYFISFDTHPGCASKIVKMAADAGVKLTKAGATFPYGKDPHDCNIRIAPSLPSVAEIKQAMEVLSVVTKIVTLAE